MTEENDRSPWGPLTPEELAQQAADKSGLWLPGMDDTPRHTAEDGTAWANTPGFMKQQQPITLESLQRMKAEMDALGPPVEVKVVHMKGQDFTAGLVRDAAGQNEFEAQKAKDAIDQITAAGRKPMVIVGDDAIYIMPQPDMAKEIREMIRQSFDSAVNSMGIPPWAFDPPIDGPDPRTADLRGLTAAMVDRIAEPPRHWNCRCTMIPAVRWWNLPRHQRRLRWNRHARRRILIAEMTTALRDFPQADHGDAVDARTKT